MYKRRFRFCTGLICLLMVLVFPLSAFAAESDQTGSLAVSFFLEDRAVSGATFHIYRVADEDYQPVGAYADYPVLLEGLSSEEWGTAATTLTAYTMRDGIAATRSDETNVHGYVAFSDLQIGLYLVVGETYVKDDIVYNPLPFLAAIPNYDTDDQPVYDLIATPKYDMWRIDERLERGAQKVWSDNGYENARPNQITVQLLENGKVADEVLLSDANDWSYSWKDLDPTSVWMIVEKTVPEGYTVTVAQQNTLFTVINTYKIPNTPPPGDDAEPSPTLPQTGQLWWPVPILLFAGALMLFVGAFISRKSGNKDA